MSSSIKRAGTTLIVQPPAPHTATVIFMHGLGDTADGWIDVAAGFGKALPHAKFILPTAETIPITINGGYPMPGWYDIKSLSAHRELESCEGIHASRDRVAALIKQEHEKHGVPINRIVLAGFSQGGAMSVFVGLNHPGVTPLGGIVVMSGYMPLPKEVLPSPAALLTPILQCHGDADGVVPLDYGKDCHDRLVKLGSKEAAFKSPSLEAALHQLIARIPGVQHVFVSNSFGLPIARVSAEDATIDAGPLETAYAVMFARSSEAADKLHLGKTKTCCVFASGFLLVQASCVPLVVAVAAAPFADAGVIHAAMPHLLLALEPLRQAMERETA